MKRLVDLDVLLFSGLLALAGGVALFSQSQDTGDYPTIAEDREPLRTAFNASPDDVRAILLASPT